MSHRPLHSFRLFGLLALLLLALPLGTPARAADPGEQIFTSSGAVNGGQTLSDQPIYSFNGQANFRLEVNGGSADETLTALFKDGGGNPVATLVVRNGEAVWGTMTLPAGSRVALTNNSGVRLNYALAGYAVDVAPDFADGVGTWSGISKSVGIQSAATISVPSNGLYRFTLGATGGSYQLVVDNNYIRKTVKAGSAPDPADSVYYLSAGNHTFSVVQDPTAGVVTGWSVNLAPVGGSDALPSAEASAVLGGGSFFREEWVPVFVDAGATVDIRIEVTGGAADSLSVELLNGTTRVYSSTSVLGGEVTWGSSTLAAGANALHIVARNGNGAPLSYNVQLQTVPQAPFSWSGKTRGDVNRPEQGASSIQLTFPSSGLYTFGMAANSGRFQFLLADDYIQKTVTDTTSTSLSAYVEAGTYTLKVAQDPQQPLTDWKIDVQPGNAASDTLPYVRRSSTLGTTDGSAFNEEWLPLQSDAKRPVNLKIVATGATSDSLRIELYNGAELKYAAATVYGGEVFWAPAEVMNGTNRLHIIANGQGMGYDLTVAPIADAPTAWTGISAGNGLHSSALLNAPVKGVYDVVLTIEEGEGRVLVGDAIDSTQPPQLAANVINLRVELARGLHPFTVEQDSTLPRTSWSMSVTLRRELPDDSPTGTTYTVMLPVVVKGQ